MEDIDGGLHPAVDGQSLDDDDDDEFSGHHLKAKLGLRHVLDKTDLLLSGLGGEDLVKGEGLLAALIVGDHDVLL